MRKLYEENEGFKQYVDRYCVKEEVTKDEAFTHSVVKNAYEYYKDDNKATVTKTDVNYGCGGTIAGGDCK